MAGAKDGGKSNIKQRFDDVCKELNMDEATAISAWETYEKIDQNYTLEVRQISVITFRGKWKRIILN
jgi:hypothetical protein